MDSLPSSKFRREYARLTEATEITANGRPIGVWTPTGSSPRPEQKPIPVTPTTATPTRNLKADSPATSNREWTHGVSTGAEAEDLTRWVLREYSLKKRSWR